jgi:hypothetical protein
MVVPLQEVGVLTGVDGSIFMAFFDSFNSLRFIYAAFFEDVLAMNI